MGVYLPARQLRGLVPKQMPRSFAPAALSPRGHPAVVAVGRRPRRLDAFRRAVEAELDRDGIRAGEVRVVRVDEEPRRLELAGAGPAHSGRGSGGGEGYAVVAVCAVRCAARNEDCGEGERERDREDVLSVGWAVVMWMLVELDEELTR